jgi:ABC-type sugar transport system permease subunit
MSKPEAAISLPGAVERKSVSAPLAVHKRLNRDNLTGYLFVSPWLIGFLLFALIPMVISLGLAFTDYDILGSAHFIGLGNFQRMFFEDPRYLRSLAATFKFVGISVPLRLAFALGVALLLNSKRRGVFWYRAAYYIPSIIGGSVAVAVMWRQLFGNEGLLNAILTSLDIPTVAWLGKPETAIWTLIILAIWQFGSPMLVFLAGLRQIPAELYEAASIDGANRVQQFTGVTLPLLTPVIFFNVIMQVIGGFKVFTQAFIVTNGTGQPLDTTLLYSLYLYNRAFTTYQMGYASAMAWIMLIIIAVLTLISFRLSSVWVFYEAKEG